MPETAYRDIPFLDFDARKRAAEKITDTAARAERAGAVERQRHGYQRGLAKGKALEDVFAFAEQAVDPRGPVGSLAHLAALASLRGALEKVRELKKL